MCHLTDHINEVPIIQVFKPILVRIMSVGMAVEIMSGGVLRPVLITSILGRCQDTCKDEDKGLTQYSSLLNMKGMIAQPWLVW